MNASCSSSRAQDYASVRVCASLISFLLLAFFNVLINAAIVRDPHLRGQARFVLVFHLLSSGLAYFAVNSAFYLQIYLDARLPQAACTALLVALIASASNILLTLTAMALDRYCAVCFPLQYSALCGRQRPWLVGVATWGLSLIIPLSLFLGPAPQPGSLAATCSPNASQPTCGRDQLQRGELQKILLVSLCTSLILFSYGRILQEGRRLGVLSRRNRAGRKTIAMHGVQLAVYILPNFVSFLLHLLKLPQETRALFGVVNFAFFSLAQCIAPVVYGLRKEELLERLHLRWHCLSWDLKGALAWTLRTTTPGRHHPPPRERAMTSAQRLLSVDGPSQTSV
ncbi:odorant receptor 131-2 [Amia ocellicauda]|uniref:odorant receptor 131-2 n=1 Tax=Amia ocellicauda TaxID=2972642 RepID=UPI0034645D76